MAASFVPALASPAAYRSWIKTASPTYISTSASNCEPSSPESISSVRGIGPRGVASPQGSQGGPSGLKLDGSSTMLEVEGLLRDGWVERPSTLTLLGYQTLKERAKFTVYKILVIESQGDSWVIFKRYTDFCRLNDKLKEQFPAFCPGLPPKRWFKDNYDEEFLEERQTGLQTFLQNLTCHKDIIGSEAVRQFLCFVDPPSPFDSLEESRALCETLEETNHRLQRELFEKQREVNTLKKTLVERENHISFLLKKVK